MTSGAYAAAFPFEVFSIPIGTLIVSVALILFVFTTLLTWSYYGERAITYLYDLLPGSSPKRREKTALSCGASCLVPGHLPRLLCTTCSWSGGLGDISNAVMTLPNIVALASAVRCGLCASERQAHGRHRPWPGNAERVARRSEWSCRALIFYLKRRARASARLALRANKARRPVGLASVSRRFGAHLESIVRAQRGKRDRAPELMRGKPSGRMPAPGA